MFQATSGLPHLLSSAAYHQPDFYAREQAATLRSAWHLVGTLDLLDRPGDFLTVNLLGEELQLRNFDGKVKVFSNVCAHRHCLLTEKPCGNTPTMKCQYHGWEYGDDGLTRKIPCAKDFAPIDRAALRLTEHRVEMIGQLVFVCLDPSAANLIEFLGPIAALVSERFDTDWKSYYRREFDYAANWKVAIENSLEAYHIEAIHPQTFRNSPGEQRSEHQLNEKHSSFLTDLPFASNHRWDRWFVNWESWVVRRLGGIPQQRYQQHHVFPHLLFSFTDAISLVHAVHPLTPDRSRSLVVQFGFAPRRAGFWQKGLSSLLGKAEAIILDRIMREDLGLYPVIQRGMRASRHRGVLARSEERIHHFHRMLTRAIQQQAIQSIEGFHNNEEARS